MTPTKPENLAQLQDILYDILCEIDDICTRKHIPYFLDGGTLLGAVRHQGFIPWDDDIDLICWRKDYARMIRALKAGLPPHLKVIGPSDLCPNFHDFIYRVADLRYYLHEPAEEDVFYGNKQNHVCVDLFVIDYSGNSMAEVRKNTFLQKIVYGLAMGHRYQLKRESYTLLQKIQTGFLSAAGSKIKMERILHMQKSLCLRCSRKPSRYCMHSNGLLKNIDLPYHSSWYNGRCARRLFRSRRFPVPRGYDQWLTMHYGDYMTPVRDSSEYIQHFE